MDILIDLFTNYTLRTVALGTLIIGSVSGLLGTFAFLRKQSLLGDAISHAALPGVVIAFLLTGNRGPLTLLTGALVAGWLGTLLVLAITGNTRIKEDSALGITLSVFFGAGLMLLDFALRVGSGQKAGLERFLFGQAATLIEQDVITMAVIGAVAVIIVIAFWKEFKLVSFDMDFAESMGYPVQLLSVALTTLLVVAIVIGLQAVGVILMSAMVVAPASAARQWTNRLSVMAGLAALFGGVSGMSGAVISSTRTGLSTGPVIVVCMSVIAVASLLFAPQRGLVWGWLQQQRNKQRLQQETILIDLQLLELQHPEERRGHSAAALEAMNVGLASVRPTLKRLIESGLAREVEADRWVLTQKGSAEASRLLRETSFAQLALTQSNKEEEQAYGL